uniref:hypothetical protein n=1 Tax=Alloprevotella sp. TaxID=1872471 RepID=UPI004029EBCA
MIAESIWGKSVPFAKTLGIIIAAIALAEDIMIALIAMALASLIATDAMVMAHCVARIAKAGT